MCVCVCCSGLQGSSQVDFWLDLTVVVTVVEEPPAQRTHTLAQGFHCRGCAPVVRRPSVAQEEDSPELTGLEDEEEDEEEQEEEERDEEK